MKQTLYIIIIAVLVIGLFGSLFYSNNQTKELQNTLQQKETSIESLNNQVQQLKNQIADLSAEKDIGTLSGKITLASGNCMPMVCDNPPCPSSCSIVGTSRNIYIREVANSDDMDITYLKEDDKPSLVKTITSGSDGSFIVILPVGKYSLFVEDDSREYCNSWDGQGNSCMFEIKKDQTTEYNSQIDHAAW